MANLDANLLAESGTPDLPPPLDPLNRPPDQQFCDVVLKGGVVDGVVYPGVLIELARKYRFQSIAGTSVGAIAGALTAAAEYARRFGSDAGFNEVLRRVPERLAEPAKDRPRRTTLRSLFHVSPKLQRLFNFAVDAVSASKDSAGRTLIRSIWKHYRGIMLWSGFLALIALIFAPVWLATLWELAIALPGGVCTFAPALRDSLWLPMQPHVSNAFLVSPIIVPLAACAGFILVMARELRFLAAQSGWGFASGMPDHGNPSDAMTTWVHRGIQAAANLPEHEPLTFRDLWDAPNGPGTTDASGRYKSIDFRVVTTSVSHGRPYELPLEDRSVRLFFKLNEWRDYFPEDILKHLRIHAIPYDATPQAMAPQARAGQPPTLAPAAPPPDRRYADLLELPLEDLPVLVAVRLSMNFPILFRSVPLWSIDYERWDPASINSPLEFRRAWFGDGGITSNFPLHIFDKPVPAWPTFGIYIQERSRKEPEPGQRKSVGYNINATHTRGRSEKWNIIEGRGSTTDLLRHFPPDEPAAATPFFLYLLAIATSAKDWADNANLRMPGVRDRVVYVFKEVFKKGKWRSTGGGLNLNILGEDILHLAYKNGTDAGTALARKFAGPDTVPNNPALGGSNGWLDHRWVRLNTYLNALREHLDGLSSAARSAYRTAPLQMQIQQSATAAPLTSGTQYEPALTSAQANALGVAIQAVEALEQALTKTQMAQPYEGKPAPELRSRARL